MNGGALQIHGVDPTKRWGGSEVDSADPRESPCHRFPEFLKGLEAWRVVFYAVACRGP